MSIPEKILAALPERSVLSGMSAEEIAEIMRFAVSRRLSKGEVLCEQGDPGDSLMIVIQGLLKACVYSPSGKEVVLDYIGAGSAIGELAVFDGHPRAATVIAVEPAETIVIQRRDLIPFLERHPKITIGVLAQMSGRIRRTNKLLEATASLAMGPKLARSILRLARDIGSRGSDGRVTFNMSQGEIGNYANLSRENVNRQLKEWEAEGLVKIGRGRITVADREGLEDIAEAWG